MREYNIHRLFEASVTLKGIHALLELATGAATLAVGPVRVSNFFFALAQREWLGGAHLWVVNFLVRLADASLRGGQEFVAIYLLVVGVINMVLVIGLLASALWAYPGALTAIALLMTYHYTGHDNGGYCRYTLDFTLPWLAVIAPGAIGPRRQWFTLACLGWSVFYFYMVR